MKISRLELAALFLTAVFLAFAAGWFLRGSGQAIPLRVETERVLRADQAEVPLPTTAAADTPAPSGHTGLVNINTADAETLQTLPGIGEKRAEDIVAYRAAHGAFRIPEDLTRVPGIGEGILKNIIDQITTGGENP